MIIALVDKKALPTVCGGGLKLDDESSSKFNADMERVLSWPVCNYSALNDCVMACAFNVAAYFGLESLEKKRLLLDLQILSAASGAEKLILIMSGKIYANRLEAASFRRFRQSSKYEAFWLMDVWD